MKAHYKQLTQMAMAVKGLFPGTGTAHAPTERISPGEVYPEDLRCLYELLVHAVTLLNKLYRQKDREGNYISQREDYATALMLLSPLFNIKLLKVPEGTREYYHALVSGIGFSERFSRADLQRLTGKSKTSCNNALQSLMEQGLIRRSGHGYRQVYLYELVMLEKQKGKTEQALSQFEEISGEWGQLRRWEDV